jgi:hypothetical protein
MIVRFGSPEYSPWWDDLKAIVVLLLASVAGIVGILNVPLGPLPAWTEHIVLGIVLFYFGSR